MAIHGIHITNGKSRNAEVAFQSQPARQKIRTVLKDGKEKQNVRILKSTVEIDEEALEKRFGSWEDIADALIDGDPELNMEITGKKLLRTRRLWVDENEQIAYRINLFRTVFNPDGSERERQDIHKLPGNVNLEDPLKWTGRMFPRKEIVRRFVFTRSYQLRHIDGATFDFLFSIAKELDGKDALVMLGGGKNGNEPLLLTRGGQPYRAFLEGRIKEDRYMLILHLTDIELKTSENEDIKNTGNREVKKLTQRAEKEDSKETGTRSEMPFIQKIKPRHTINAVVVGFTEDTGEAQGQVREILLALSTEEDKYQVVTRLSVGMTQKQRRDLYAYFSSRILSSGFIDTDSNHVAFQMVEPDKVVEISLNDVHWKSPEGNIQNPVLEIVEGKYRVAETVDGISFVAPVIEKFRDGKRGEAVNVGLSQLEEISPFDPGNIKKIPFSQLPRSEMLFREVYKKTMGDKIMILKFTGWKTNKEKAGDWPAYVLHTTNFSTNRQQHLLRDVEITNDYNQLFELLEKAIDTHVKKGWIKVE